MGPAISAMRALVKNDDKEKENTAKQDLEILQKMVDSVLDKYEHHIDATFLNPAATAKTEIPGIRALRKERFSTAQVSDKPTEEVGKAIDGLFSIGDEGVKAEDALKKGFKSIVKTALNIFLGHTEIGQHEETKYFIYMLNNAVVRLDLKLFKWNFIGKGFSDNYKSVLGYYVCISIVDVKILKTPEFVFLVSQYANAAGIETEEQTELYIEKMGKLYTRARKFAKEAGGDDHDEYR